MSTVMIKTDWLTDYRQYHDDAFKQHGLPTPKNEYWKHTDLSLLAKTKFSSVNSDAKKNTLAEDKLIRDVIANHRITHGNVALLVMIDGCFSPELSELSDLSNDLIVCSLKDALKNHNELVKKYWPDKLSVTKSPFACLNAALFNDGIFIYVPKKCEIKAPIHILSIVSSQHNDDIHPRNLIILANESSLYLFEEFVSLRSVTREPFMINTVTTVTLEDNAKLNYIKLQNPNAETIHFGHFTISQHQSSEFSSVNFILGAKFTREDLTINLQAPYATCHTSGFYQTTEHTVCIDNHVAVNHLAANTTSNMLYKGILNHPTRAIFNGRVYVESEAKKISAYQANHNLLLVDGAEVYSKPELEIYANDVKCKHGSTIGQIDPLALFYLCSRGIEINDAKKILLQGFAKEIIQCITDPTIKNRIEQTV